MSIQARSTTGRHTLGLTALSIFCVMILAIFLFFPNVAHGDYIEPGKVSISTVAYKPGTVPIPDGAYRYRVSWQGISVAQAVITVTHFDNEFGQHLLSVVAEARSARSIRWLYDLVHRTETILDAETFRPVMLLSEQKENSREMITQVVFRPDHTIKSYRWRKGRDSSTYEFKSENLTLDPISAAFLARTQPAEIGHALSFDVYNGKHRYLISMTPKDRKRIKLRSGVEREVFRVVPAVQRLTDSKGEDRLKSATVFVAADGTQEPLRLESKVFIGKVVAELESFEPAATKTRAVTDSPVATSVAVGNVTKPLKIKAQF